MDVGGKSENTLVKTCREHGGRNALMDGGGEGNRSTDRVDIRDNTNRLGRRSNVAFGI